MPASASFARAVGALGLIALLLLAVGCQRQPDLPDYGPTPRFALTDQSGASVRSEDLGGHVVVMDFVYTRCTDACPLLSARMRDLQERLKSEGLFGARVLLLSVSVDPAYDTPPVLAEYAARFHADPAGWRFLTGEKEIVWHLLQDGFKVGQPDPGRPKGDDPNWLHTTRYVILDPAGHVRGYPGYSDWDVDALVPQLRALTAA